jgi:hypothetical protein
MLGSVRMTKIVAGHAKSKSLPFGCCAGFAARRTLPFVRKIAPKMSLLPLSGQTWILRKRREMWAN